MRVADNRPRIFHGSRDIILSLIVTGVVMVGAVGFTGMCTWNPGAPEQGQIPEVDASTFISMEARGMEFAVREPAIPEGWVTNSVRRAMVDDTPAPVIGYITKDTGYIQLTQSGETVQEAVEGYDGRWRDFSESYDLNGHTVEIFVSEASDVRDLRVVDLEDARILLSGAATDEEFNELISSAIAAQPLTKN